jgi:hypothetical protein
MGSGFDKAIYLTSTLRSYNYLLHSLTPRKLYPLCPVLSPVFFLVSILSVRSISVSVFLSHSFLCTRSILPFLADECLFVLQSSSNPLKVALGVPSRGHSVEQFSFSLLSCKHLSRYCENKGLPSRWLAMDVYSSSWDCVYRALLSNWQFQLVVT